MKQHPLIFSLDSIRKILVPEKFQTRRVMTPSNTLICDKKPSMELRESIRFDAIITEDDLIDCEGKKRILNSPLCLELPSVNEDAYLLTPRIEPGDQIWCRHEHWIQKTNSSKMIWDQATRILRTKDKQEWHYRHWPDKIWIGIRETECNFMDGIFYKKRSSIFLPKWAALVWLNVLRVWPERLKDISEADAKAEGVWGKDEPYQGVGDLPSDRYIDLFLKLNPSASEDSWVWAYEFELIERQCYG